MTELTPIAFDLSGHETARVAAVLAACADDMDLLAMYHAECDARRMLYSSLDAEQRAIHKQLVDDGILT
jgi:hypothetical protein